MRPVGALFALFLIFWMSTGDALAHEVCPGYLELREVGDQTYDVLWKVPAKGSKRLALYS